MGKSSGEISRQAHQLQQPGNFPRTVQPALFPPFPDSKPLANDILDPEAGIGGGGVVLENYAEFVLQVPTPGTGAVDRNAIQKGLAAVRPEQAAQHPPHGGLSAARLSQNTQAGSFFYGEGHVEQHLLSGVAEYSVLPLAAKTDADILQFKHKTAPFPSVPAGTGASHPPAFPPAAWCTGPARGGRCAENLPHPPRGPG